MPLESFDEADPADLRADASTEPCFPLGFPVLDEAWAVLRIEDLLEALPDAGRMRALHTFRRLADRLNEQEKATPRYGYVRAGELTTAALLCEILRYIFDLYCNEQNPGAMLASLDWTRVRHGLITVEQPVERFVRLFPPLQVLLGREGAEEYLEGRTHAQLNRALMAREVILLHVTTANPAMRPFLALFDDTTLRNAAPYDRFVESAEAYFRTQPAVAPMAMTLLDVLRAPARHSPHSLEGQLEYIRKHWAAILPAHLMHRLLLARDVLREETRMRGLGPGPVEALRFGPGEGGLDLHYDEPERFSRDADWMANVVLIAKSTYVWLDQLSKRYQRAITRLDQIPDEELDRLAQWGFTGLWLIGLWERSVASGEIKRRMGNPEALPSAYSLYDYEIAQDLGGAAAYEQLRERAWARGIRLASDMVPNHVGLYSKWVIEHPEWFVQLDQPPFPSYRFTGPDLSLDSSVTLQIEDGYWNHSDAAVVFKRTCNRSGEVRYIYHGNDGTSMPWNDTAQLDYMKAAVREAVIQTILHVARMFPIIRFDAAMTLAKKHYQRLWFPQPGEGGAIPSRAEHALTRAQFDAAMPEEFWREVVERIQREAPDTLLLAEAFWLMEGYFVRTLGMHRVYNSAFMNMLKTEDNAKYRTTIKNVLEFSPEILCRFVNFMNNPDERTAVEQFGRGEKYFGVVMMMVTMPGLPMFGHGQIEGFTEKYGMEYRRAYWDEAVDEGLLRHHEAAIFPLARRRYLFSGSRNFRLFDFFTPEGHVDENVFAYSNRAGDERALVIFHNAYASTRGWVRSSSAVNTGPADAPVLRQYAMGESLGLRSEDDMFYVFRDYRTHMEYLRRGRDLCEQGLFVELGEYHYHAFLDWREIRDVDGSWARLADRLGGAAVPSIQDAYTETILGPVLDGFRRIMDPLTLRAVAEAGVRRKGVKETMADYETALTTFYATVGDHLGRALDAPSMAKRAIAEIAEAQKFRTRVKALDLSDEASDFLCTPPPNTAKMPTRSVCVPLVVSVLQPLSTVFDIGQAELRAAWLEHWHLKGIAEDAFADLGWTRDDARANADLVQLLLRFETVLDTRTPRDLGGQIARLFESDLARDYLGVNFWDGVWWLNKERAESLFHALAARAVMAGALVPKKERLTVTETAELRSLAALRVLHAIERGGYQVEKTLDFLA